MIGVTENFWSNRNGIIWFCNRSVVDMGYAARYHWCWWCMLLIVTSLQGVCRQLGEWNGCYMSVRLARKAGFCMGVRRALNLTVDCAFGSRYRVGTHEQNIYTLGPLIHNPQVVSLLREQGIVPVDAPEDVSDGTVVIRAHGIPPDMRRRLRGSGVRVCDATCPRVARVQAIVKRKAREGALVLIAGDVGHAEVVGLEGYADGRARVVDDLDDIERIEPTEIERFDPEKVCLVAQTTQNRLRFDELAAAARRRWPAVEVFDTLCSSTDERQEEVVELARWADALVVVGGRDSANTGRLVDVAAAAGKPTFQVETASELDESELARFDDIGVTAGASTPNWLIQEVVGRLQAIQSVRPGPLSSVRRAARFVGELSADLGIVVSLGAGCMTYAGCRLQGVPGNVALYALASLYVLAMVLFNNFADHATAVFSEPRRARFYSTYRRLIIAAATGAVACAALLALVAGWLPFAMMLLAIAVGVSYTLPGFPKWLMRLFHRRRLRDLPASKDAASALGWASVCVIVPFLAHGGKVMAGTAVAFSFVVIIVFIRSVLTDIRRIQGDRLVGKETIPTVVGIGATKVILGVMAIALAALLISATMNGWIPKVGYGLVACVLYACGYLYLYHERIIFQGLSFEAVVDSNFLLAGVIAIIME